TPRPPIPVHLPAAGAWPCASLPAVNEDQRWNHAETTVGIWSVNGTVGALSFKLTARTVYDPALDPPSDWSLYLRWGAGIAVAGGVLVAIPYLFTKRREILGGSKKTSCRKSRNLALDGAEPCPYNPGSLFEEEGRATQKAPASTLLF